MFNGIFNICGYNSNMFHCLKRKIRNTGSGSDMLQLVNGMLLLFWSQFICAGSHVGCRMAQHCVPEQHHSYKILVESYNVQGKHLFLHMYMSWHLCVRVCVSGNVKCNLSCFVVHFCHCCKFEIASFLCCHWGLICIYTVKG